MLGKVFKVFEIGRFGSIFNKRIYHFSSSFPKFDASKDYYDILKVTKESSESEIKISYYQLAKEYHPDANPGKQAQFKEISQAYSVLSNPQTKKEYNSSRTFQGFSRRMRSKAKKGHYRYEQYRYEYTTNFTEEQKAEIRAQMEKLKRKMRSLLYLGVSIFIFSLLITRNNHTHYALVDGKLEPINEMGNKFQVVKKQKENRRFNLPQGVLYQNQAPPGYFKS